VTATIIAGAGFFPEEARRKAKHFTQGSQRKSGRDREREKERKRESLRAAPFAKSLRAGRMTMHVGWDGVRV
jgi:hypothetical protein